MKLKYYLRGIGIGLIVTTVILMITFSIHGQKPLTDEEIIARATELGMVRPEQLSSGEKLSDSDTSGKLTDADQSDVKDEKQPTDAVDDPASDNTDQDSNKTEESEKTEQSEETEELKDAKEPETIEQVEVTIVGGEYSAAVCKKLEKAGVIEDADDFNKYLAQGGYDNLIQPGNYVLEVGADYDTIVKSITEKKKKKQ